MIEKMTESEKFLYDLYQIPEISEKLESLQEEVAKLNTELKVYKGEFFRSPSTSERLLSRFFFPKILLQKYFYKKSFVFQKLIFF